MKNILIKFSFALFISFFIILTFYTNVLAINMNTNQTTISSEKIIKLDANGTTTEVDMEDLKEKLMLIEAKSNISSNIIPGFNPNSNLYLERNDIAQPTSLLPDDYTQVTNIEEYPYKVTCRIIADNGYSYGSGFLVAPNLMLTAAHVVYNKDSNNDIREFLVYPAYNGNAYTDSSGNKIFSDWQAIYRSSIWLETHNQEYDWALVELQEDFNLGYWGSIRYATDTEMDNLSVRALGYPKNPGNAKYQYYSPGTVEDVYTRYFISSCDNSGGMSGGPIGLNSPEYYEYAIGIISGRVNNLISPKTYGIRYTEYMTDIILSYIY